VSLPSREEKIAHAIFQQASVTIQVGNGLNTLFWVNHWLDGSSIDSTVPNLVSMVALRGNKLRTMADVLQ
jgi:hypothetical protein